MQRCKTRRWPADRTCISTATVKTTCEALRDRTLRDRKDLIELSRSIEKLDELLRAKAKGFSLEALYAEIPSLPAGHGRDRLRFEQPAVVPADRAAALSQPFYDDALQSVMLSVISADDRPFVMSTPRLERAMRSNCRFRSPANVTISSSA